ncbi:hypothetical protein PPL_10154 [Heterostelium album PN500]|uniref:Follistatin-like domain-containing protein n=1 Tax=Heterostelium pallidum (strain ATCC 26659 / Pp 5 / PN500) TaxID=670386 RepID=D3BQG9_HETP5|nr:hypothetical protein PPL_10154 [Heterostelium album PN500]EFA76389.1 hypothetical protein PPL_10154 [Heterostelium album PN500]|eukprot:XP_020428521.1 hypothetical protein PPL_10154 [Heterostelium album PN500]
MNEWVGIENHITWLHTAVMLLLYKCEHIITFHIEELSCGTDQSGNTYEFWSSCKPSGFKYTPLPNATCESLGCERYGQTCEWVNSSPCYGTACCPRVPRCSGGATSSSGSSSGSSGTTAGACNNYNCPQGKFCILQNGQPVCIDGSSGQSSGTTGGDPCRFVQCPEGYHCINNNGNGACAPNGGTSGGIGLCANVDCPNGQHCVLENGRPQCIFTNTGSATSGGIGLCANVDCPNGQHCVLENGRPQCIFTNTGSATSGGNICGLVECSHGQVCVTHEGRPKCIYLPDAACKLHKCPRGHHCVVGKGGFPKCVASTCDSKKCKPGQKCILNNGIPTCIEISPPITSGGGLCALIHCAPDKICKEIGGVPICVPKPDPCHDVICSGGKICINVKGQPACVQPTCHNFACPPNYRCFMDDGHPNCVPFGGGTSGGPVDCESIYDSAMCISNRHCALQAIKSCCGNIMEVCVNRPEVGCQPDFSNQCAINPKDNQIYHLDNTCKPTKGLIPYTPPASNQTCESLDCGARGMACITVKSSTCVNEPCCPAVAICTPYHISAGSTIATTTASTASTTASTIAMLVTTTATTTASTTSMTTARPTTHQSSTFGPVTTSTHLPDACFGVHCPEDEVCCQPDPSLAPRCVGKCDLVTCEQGSKCILNNGIPTCVIPIGLNICVRISLATTSILMLPLDVANKGGTGGFPMDTMWLAIYIIIAVFAIVIVPFAIFFYESDEADGHAVLEAGPPPNSTTDLNNTQLKSWWSFLLCTSPNSFNLTLTQQKLVNVQIPTFVEAWVQSASQNKNNTLTPTTLYSYSGYTSDEYRNDTEFITFRVSIALFVITMVSFGGWFLFVLFGGIGVAALPMDMITDFRFRPQRISYDVYLKQKQKIGEKATELLEIGKTVQANHRGGIITGRKQKRNYNRFKAAVFLLEDDYEHLKICYQRQGGKVIFYYVQLFLGFIAAALSITWVLQNILYMWTQPEPFFPFLNSFFIKLDGAWGFLGTITYGIYSLYLLLCVVKGNFKFGLRLFFLFPIHPMRVGGTMMNAFLFNVGMILVCCVSITQFCTMAFSQYASTTAINSMFSLAVRNIMIIKYFWVGYIIAFFGMALLSAILLTIFRKDGPKQITFDEKNK